MGTELVKQENAEVGVSIFGQLTYADQIKKATDLATAIAKIVDDKKLFNDIQGKKFVRCEGWTTMGAMLGLFPQIVEMKEEPGRCAATCEVRTLAGNLVSRAEGYCSKEEKSKKNFDDYAVRSMAQTRAVSKAFRIALSWVMVLAGYQPTPAEEMDGIVIETDAEPVKTEPPKAEPAGNPVWEAKFKEVIDLYDFVTATLTEAEEGAYYEKIHKELWPDKKYIRMIKRLVLPELETLYTRLLKDVKK